MLVPAWGLGLKYMAVICQQQASDVGGHQFHKNHWGMFVEQPRGVYETNDLDSIFAH